MAKRSHGTEVINICPCGVRPAHLQAFLPHESRPHNLKQLILKACPACADLQPPEVGFYMLLDSANCIQRDQDKRPWSSALTFLTQNRGLSLSRPPILLHCMHPACALRT